LAVHQQNAEYGNAGVKRIMKQGIEKCVAVGTVYNKFTIKSVIL
jgi:hypothetical protein